MILHIVARADWDSALARGIYAPPSLDAEGFIHCSTSAQILRTANRFYRRQTDLVILCIDESRLEAAPKYEPPNPALGETSADLFPHLYRPTARPRRSRQRDRLSMQRRRNLRDAGRTPLIRCRMMRL